MEAKHPNHNAFDTRGSYPWAWSKYATAKSIWRRNCSHGSFGLRQSLPFSPLLY